jgi:DNA-binding transcriptional MerR regulator
LQRRGARRPTSSEMGSDMAVTASVPSPLDSGVDSSLYSKHGAKRLSQAARIGKVAQETGLSVDTIRFYQKQGLLTRLARSKGGFRLFDRNDIETLKFLRKAQELGFSLNEIRELLTLRSDHVLACSHVKELLDQKLTAVIQKITEL